MSRIGAVCSASGYVSSWISAMRVWIAGTSTPSGATATDGGMWQSWHDFAPFSGLYSV